MNLNSALSWNL